MKEKRYHLAMDERERMEDLILKAANAPDKKVRVVERKQDEAR